MHTLSVPSLGKAVMHLRKAQNHARAEYARMTNCKSCDKEVAASWREAAEFYDNLLAQLKEKIDV